MTITPGPVPGVFYKYTTLDTARIVLETGCLRWSSPLEFNDITEFQRMPRFVPTLDEARKALPGFLVDVAQGKHYVDETRLAPAARVFLSVIRALLRRGDDPSELRQIQTDDLKGGDMLFSERIRAQFGSFGLDTARVICLTTDPTNSAMWAHYAKNHTGAVIGFYPDVDHDSALFAAVRVAYSDEAPIVGSGMDFVLYGNTPELRERIMDAVCCSKSSHWEYEEEWRVVSWEHSAADEKHSEYQFRPSEIESICFGARVVEEKHDELCEVTRKLYPHCSLYRIELNKGVLTRVLE